MFTDNEIKHIQLCFDVFAKHNYIENKIQYYEDTIFIDNVSGLEDYIKQQKIENPDTLKETIDDMLIDMEVNRLDDIIEEFYQEWKEQLHRYVNEDKINETSLREEIFESDIIEIHFKYDRDVYEKIKLNVCFILETDKTIDQEYTPNNFHNLFMTYHKDNIDDIYELYDVLQSSSVKTLLEKQNYCVDQLITYFISSIHDQPHPLDMDDTFISIVNEIENAQNTNALICPKEMTLKDFIAFKDNENQMSIHINKNSTLGYLDPVMGSASMFDIHLKQNMIYQPHEFTMKLDGTFGYTFNDIFGNSDIFKENN